MDGTYLRITRYFLDTSVDLAQNSTSIGMIVPESPEYA